MENYQKILDCELAYNLKYHPRQSNGKSLLQHSEKIVCMSKAGVELDLKALLLFMIMLYARHKNEQAGPRLGHK